MNIDRQAALTAKKEILIDAPIKVVWELSTDINNWPTWQPEISQANIMGELKKGTQFIWKTAGMSITSQLEEVNQNKSIGWTGKSLGTKAIHIWKFETKDKKTKVTTEESLSGWLPKLIKLIKSNFLENTLESALRILKNQAEKTKKSTSK